MKYIVDPFSEKTSLNTPYRLLRHYAEKWPDKEALVFDAEDIFQRRGLARFCPKRTLVHVN